MPDFIIADVGSTLLRRVGDGFSPISPLQCKITQGWPGREQILAAARQIEGLHFQEEISPINHCLCINQGSDGAVANQC
jgi:hypothetical protein